MNIGDMNNVKMYMRDLPENYIPAEPEGMCGGINKMKFGCSMKRYVKNPGGLGMNNISDLMDALFAAEHNDNAKGVQVERVGNESEMKKIVEPALDMAKGIGKKIESAENIASEENEDPAYEIREMMNQMREIKRLGRIKGY